MKILVVGASGAIGAALSLALRLRGHEILAVSRDLKDKVPGERLQWCYGDYERDTCDDWRAHLTGVDVAVNCAGIYCESPHCSFAAVHTVGPLALFAACREQDVKVLQVSALGADSSEPPTDFLASKRAADQALRAVDPSAVIVYPGVVLGTGGPSDRLFKGLAALPIIPVLSRGRRTLSVVTLEVLVARLVSIIDAWPRSGMSLVVVSGAPPMADLLSGLRRWMGLGTARFVSLPEGVARSLSWALPRHGLISRDSLTLYLFLGRPACVGSEIEWVELNLPDRASAAVLRGARGYFLKCLAIACLSLVWIWSGVCSLWLAYPLSLELLAELGIYGAIATATVISGAVADMVLGVGLWAPRWRARVLVLQICSMVVYTLGISLFIPAWWLHPFAPIAKNLAVLALSAILLVDEA